MPEHPVAAKNNRYQAIITEIFQAHFRDGMVDFEFSRAEIAATAQALAIPLPKNLGDVIYTFRYRNALPAVIVQTAAAGCEWIIVGAGNGLYRFRQVQITSISARTHLLPIKIPDSTPEIIGAYALSDEQALLAKVRYNRLIDLFLGLTAYSLQNHLRTTVKKSVRSKSMRFMSVWIVMGVTTSYQSRRKAEVTAMVLCRHSRMCCAAPRNSRH